MAKEIIRKIVRSILTENLIFSDDKPWMAVIRINDKSEARDFNYIKNIVEQIITERNLEHYPVKISWTTGRENDFLTGMEEIKGMLNKTYEVKLISYNPANVEHTKMFIIHFQLDNYSQEHFDAMRKFGTD
jgi:transposase-like protein